MICPVCNTKLIYGVPSLQALKKLMVSPETGFIYFGKYIYCGAHRNPVDFCPVCDSILAKVTNTSELESKERIAHEIR